ncbi:MAG: hypothetical protein VW270_04870 [Candidatus Poseidoniales archaeon]
MSYFDIKFGLATSLRKHMPKEQFEEEFGGDMRRYMNFMLWGKQNISMPANFLLGEKEEEEEDL